MAEILWDKKVGTYDKIDSDYLTPEPHAHNIEIDLDIEVYKISYDWGLCAGDELKEFVAPRYLGKLEGQVTSANFTLDSTSDMRTSGSFSIILDENSQFIVHANDSIFWQQVWFRVVKRYNYINDIDMYPMFNYGDHIGLWNNNGLFRSDPSQSIIGWFVPNDGSYSYNAESREFSLSCTDMLSFYTDTRGGHLSELTESISGLKYNFYGTIPDNHPWFENDKKFVAMQSTGMLIEGEKNLQIQDLQYDNYLAGVKNDSNIGTVWEQKYFTYKKDHEDNEVSSNFNSAEDRPFNDTASLIARIIGDYGQLIPLSSLYVHLQNDTEMLPYDMEFNGDTTLYDVLKKITDLYPRQHIFFDTNRRLNLEQGALAWGEVLSNDVRFRAREFSDLVLEEHWNVNLEGITNFTVVWGRDDSCCGYYYITSFKAICPKCGRVHEFPAMKSDGSDRYCVRCGTELQRLHVTNDTYAVQQIGTHKQVVYNDNVTNEEEAFETAKWLTVEKCRAAKTLSVTLVDRYLSMYQFADKAVGRRIEYKSKLTGETDVYTLLKWTNDFNNATVTMELEPYYSCRDEYALFVGELSMKYSCMVLPTPEFTYSVDENGLLTMIMHNGWQTAYSLFKVYCTQTSLPFGEETDFWTWSMSMNFIGETCEVYSEETETEHQTKVFRYQFTKSGRYLLTCQAWNPNILPSGCPNMKVIEVKLNDDKYVSSDDKYFVSENNENYVS